MVVDSILSHAESGQNDHRKDASPVSSRYQLNDNTNITVFNITAYKKNSSNTINLPSAQISAASGENVLTDFS